MTSAHVDAQVNKKSTIEEIRQQLLQLPYYSVFDYLAFTYDKGTVVLAGYAYHLGLKTDAVRAVKRVSGVDTVQDKVEELPVGQIDDDLRWKTYYKIYGDPFLSRYAPGGGMLWGHRHNFGAEFHGGFGGDALPRHGTAWRFPHSHHREERAHHAARRRRQRVRQNGCGPAGARSSGRIRSRERTDGREERTVYEIAPAQYDRVLGGLNNRPVVRQNVVGTNASKSHRSECRPKDCFGHRAQQVSLRQYIDGLLGDSARKSMSAMLARVSDPTSYQAFQHFITHAPWDAEGVWRRLRAVLPERTGILILDETSFPKAGGRCGRLPEVERVLGKAGRAETSTDPAPFSMMETVITLKPHDRWRYVETWYSDWAPQWLRPALRRITSDRLSTDQLVQEMNQALKLPGTTNAWTMPIKGRTDMLTTGVRTPVDTTGPRIAVDSRSSTPSVLEPTPYLGIDRHDRLIDLRSRECFNRRVPELWSRMQRREEQEER